MQFLKKKQIIASNIFSENCCRYIAIFVIFLYPFSNIILSIEPSRELFRRHISRLGSDEFLGRGTGQKGGILASEYLSAQFKEIGLTNPADLINYHQNVPIHETQLLESSKLEFITNSDTIIPQLSIEYLVHKSELNTLINKKVNLVFVGYGIVAPEFDYNDYRNVNVANKIAVMFSGEPISEDISYFYGKSASKYSQIDIKRQIALSHGAKACIVIPNPNEFSYDYWANLIHDYSFSELSLAYSPSDLLTILIIPEIAERIFKNEKIDYDSLVHNFHNNKLISFEMKSEMSFKGNYKDRSFVSSNIIGFIEGSDEKLKDSYVLVTAHYDHLGVGPALRNDSIYNGVLDNAMGVSAVLEIARIIKSQEVKPKRTIIFMLTTAEEKGLLGSIHYITNPIFPLYKTIANINIDGIAFIDNFKSVVGIGANLSDLGSQIDKTTEKLDLYQENFPQEFKEIESFNRSDQIVFASCGIPAVMVMDGTDYVHINRNLGLARLREYMFSVYHTPFDDLKQLVNYDASMQHINFLINFINDTANTDIEPQWKEWTNYNYERMKLINEKR